MDIVPVSKPEYEEFKNRVDAEDKRTNERLKVLEASAQQINSLCVSVEKLATNMEHMVGEQKAQGAKLEKLEGKDGEMWQKVVGYIATAIVGILIGFVFKQLGF